MTSIHFRLKHSQASESCKFTCDRGTLRLRCRHRDKGCSRNSFRVENQGISVEIPEDRRISEVNKRQIIQNFEQLYTERVEKCEGNLGIQ